MTCIIRKIVDERFENHAEIEPEEWRLREQVEALEAWLSEHSGELDPEYEWVADIGFTVREDAFGGGPPITRKLMQMCVDANLEIYLSEYPGSSDARGRPLIDRADGQGVSNAALERIENADGLLRIFGTWPSFHDAEVVRLEMDRSGPDGPTLELAVHLFSMTPEVDADGYFVLGDHTLVTLRFQGVASLSLEGFNGQNVLLEMEFLALDPDRNEGRRLDVTLDTSYGLEGHFQCSRCLVTDVRPYKVSK